jgi:hypothetical protein
MYKTKKIRIRDGETLWNDNDRVRFADNAVVSARDFGRPFTPAAGPPGRLNTLISRVTSVKYNTQVKKNALSALMTVGLGITFPCHLAGFIGILRPRIQSHRRTRPFLARIYRNRYHTCP